MPVVERPIKLLVLMDSRLEVSPVAEFLVGKMDQRSVVQPEPFPMGRLTGSVFTVTIGGDADLEVKTWLASLDSSVTQELKELIGSADGFMVCAPVMGIATGGDTHFFSLIEQEFKTIGKSFRTVPSVFCWFGVGGGSTSDVAEANNTYNRFASPFFHISSNNDPQLVAAFAASIRLAVKKVAEEYQVGRLTQENPSVRELDLASLSRILDELVGPGLS